MNRPTRFYSNKQEKAVAKVINGKQQSNSGATPFQKGDVVTNNWLIEAKTVIREQKTFTIQKQWLVKNKEESFAMNKEHNALVFDFGDNTRYYVIDEKTFVKMKNLLDKEDN